MKNKEIIKGLIGLDSDIKVLCINEEKRKGKIVKIIDVESTKSKVRCPVCKNFTSSIHSRLKPAYIKYLDIDGYTSYLRISKRRFRCKKCKKIFTEETSLNEKGKTTSKKVTRKILMDLREYNLSLKYIAEKNNVTDNTVRNILKNNMKGYQEHIKYLPSIISFDEFKADTRAGKYAFIMNDPIHKRTLDILPSRKIKDLNQYFSFTENRSQVQYVISDMYEPYLLVTTKMFPNAKYVVDRFHYIRYVMDALDKIRIRLQNEYDKKSKEYKLLKNKKNVSLLRKYSNDVDFWVEQERYRNGRIVKVLPGDLIQELLDINDDLRRGYQLKESFLDIVNHAYYDNAEEQIRCWIELCQESEIEEFKEAAKTINNWLPYIVNSFINERFSNGFTEGLNNKIKVIKRVGFGYKNFDFFRLRLIYILNSKKVEKTSSSKNKKLKSKKK